MEPHPTAALALLSCNQVFLCLFSFPSMLTLDFTTGRWTQTLIAGHRVLVETEPWTDAEHWTLDTDAGHWGLTNWIQTGLNTT